MQLCTETCSQFHQRFCERVFCTNVISAAFLVTCTVEKAAKMMFVRKICTFNVDEIDTWKQNKDWEENDNLRFLDNNLKDRKNKLLSQIDST